MSFATANIRAGTIGDIKLVAGDWSGSAGDANGVFSKEAGRTYSANFCSQDSANGPIQAISTTVSANATNSNATNIGVANRSTVVLGRFLIICA